MDHGNMHDMPPPSTPSMMNNGSMNGGGHHKMMMMHMTFFWGKNTEVLFSGWPGTSSGMYALCLIFVFFLAVITEWLAHSSLLRGTAGDSANLTSGLVQTAVYTLRTGLAYLVMLAVMSFNAGVFLAALAGHAIGYMLFGSRAFRNPSGDRKTNDPPASERSKNGSVSSRQNYSKIRI
ncbi:copper transporter 1 [Raphanus sativus]|uniref:Copper transport protein n=1 Tax=Raphanus sativus TaxID=3726 RepID=A0A6J0NJE7_RAPSA|nr:copper transporter 1 [Raphanus sativus]